MPLHPDAIDSNSLTKQLLDEPVHPLALGAIDQAVIVVVELRIGIGLVSKLKSLGNVIIPDDLEPRAVSQLPAFHRFVHNIPAVNPPTKMSDDLLDMLFHSFQ